MFGIGTAGRSNLRIYDEPTKEGASRWRGGERDFGGNGEGEGGSTERDFEGNDEGEGGITERDFEGNGEGEGDQGSGAEECDATGDEECDTAGPTYYSSGFLL